MSLEELEEQYKVCQNQLQTLAKQIKAKKEEIAPKCPNCGKSLWSNYWNCASFVGILMKDETSINLCHDCVNKFIEENEENIKGAWDIPDPMGG